MSIGKFVRDIIINQPETKNDDILALVKARFPEAKTSYACIAWYKSDLRKKGMISKKTVRTVEIVRSELEQTKARLAQLEAELAGFETVEETVEE